VLLEAKTPSFDDGDDDDDLLHHPLWLSLHPFIPIRLLTLE